MTIKKMVRTTVKNLPQVKWKNAKYDSSFLRLDYGQNPYAPPEGVVGNLVSTGRTLNSYPNLMNDLLEKLASYSGNPKKNILLTNGADKALRLIAETFIDPGDEALIVNPTFPVFSLAVQMMGGTIQDIKLDQNYQLPQIGEILEQVTQNTKLLYLANPNNPSGNIIASLKQIKQLLDKKILVVVDEVYIDFCLNQSVAGLVEKYDNLLIVRSFSKGFSLAGARVGYVVAQASTIGWLQRIESGIEPFNISNLSLSAAIDALESLDQVKENNLLAAKSRKELSKGLRDLGLKVIPSCTTFCLIDLEAQRIKANDFYQSMLENKIVVKDLSVYSGISKYACYIAIPTLENVDRVVKAVAKVIKG